MYGLHSYMYIIYTRKKINMPNNYGFFQVLCGIIHSFCGPQLRVDLQSPYV